MSLTLASLHVHPIKSLGGHAVDTAELTDRGLAHDRRWMLVDPAGQFVSQRELAAMACLQVGPVTGGFRITDRRDATWLEIPETLDVGERQQVAVWSDRVSVLVADAPTNNWFSHKLGRPLRLVHMPDESRRRTDDRYAKGLTSLSDGFPYLIASQASLDDLNRRLEQPVPMDRFRPNIVIAGGDAFQEDAWKAIRIGGADFQLVKPCARCVIVTTDQRTGERSKEPLRTLSGYRNKGGKVLFAMNAMGPASGALRVNDPVEVVR